MSPGSVLSAALVASAVFIIESVDAFRKGGDDALEPDGGAGGFALIGESVLPMVHDLNSAEGREAAGFTDDQLAVLEGHVRDRGVPHVARAA